MVRSMRGFSGAGGMGLGSKTISFQCLIDYTRRRRDATCLGVVLYAPADLVHSPSAMYGLTTGAAMPTVTETIKRRISTRQFLPLPLTEQIVREILDVAR